MALINAQFATDEITLTGTTSDDVTLEATGIHKILVTNISGATSLHFNVNQIATAAVKGFGTLDLSANAKHVKAAGLLTIAEPVTGDLIAAQGTLTIAEPVEGGVQAACELTIAEAGQDGDTFTLDDRVYTLETSLSNVDGNIAIGGSEAQTKLNIIAAIDLSGTAGVDYATLMTAHATVTAVSAFTGDLAVFTAVAFGTGGNSLVSTETFAGSTNVFDATTFGTEVLGVAHDTFTIASKVYTLQDTLTNTDGNIWDGGSEAQTKLNIVSAINLTGNAGTDYATAMTAHPTVGIATFTTDTAILTADTGGTDGNAIVSTETFAHANNVFDATTLGTTTLGAIADTLTIDAVVYTFRDALTAGVGVANEIFTGVGNKEARTKLNIVAAINGTGVPGRDYSSLTRHHPTVTIADFSTDTAVITYNTAGTGGNSIASTETFYHSNNILDATTLGTQVLGVAADTMTINDVVYTFVNTLDPQAADEILIGTNSAATKANMEQAFGITDGGGGSTHSARFTALNNVTAVAFSSDDMVFTAVQGGVQGNAIPTTETFSGSASFGSGTFASGVDPLNTDAAAGEDLYVVPAGMTLELLAKGLGINRRDLLTISIVGNANVYLIQALR